MQLHGSVLFEEKPTFFEGLPALVILHLHTSLDELCGLFQNDASILVQAYEAGQLKNLRELKVHRPGKTHKEETLDGVSLALRNNNVIRRLSFGCYDKYDDPAPASAVNHHVRVSASVVLASFRKLEVLSLPTVVVQDWDPVGDRELSGLREVRLEFNEDASSRVPFCKMDSLESAWVRCGGVGNTVDHASSLVDLMLLSRMTTLRVDGDRAFQCLAEASNLVVRLKKTSGVRVLRIGESIVDLRQLGDVEKLRSVFKSMPKLFHVSLVCAGKFPVDNLLSVMRAAGDGFLSCSFYKLEEIHPMYPKLRATEQPFVDLRVVLDEVGKRLHGRWKVDGHRMFRTDGPADVPWTLLGKIHVDSHFYRDGYGWYCV